MRNAKSRLLILLCSLLTVGIGLTTADFQINVGPANYFGTLNLNKLILRKGQNPGSTGIIIDGDGYSIKIGTNANINTGTIRVHEICGRTGQNCKLVSQLSTGGGITTSGKDNYICVKSGNNTLNCNQAKLGTAFNNLKYCTYSTNNGLTCNASGGTYTLPAASTSRLGGVKLGSDTTQITNANTVTTTLHRTYAIQQDRSGKLVVNVPRTDGGSGTSLRQNGSTNIIKPKSTSYNVLIGDENNPKSKITIIGSGARHETNMQGQCLQDGNRYNAQIIDYANYLILGKGGLSCDTGKNVVINNYGLGIGSIQATEDYNFRVRGRAQINTAEIGQHIFESNKVGINTIVRVDWPTLQVNGAILIGSDGHGSECTNGTIEYTGGKFYGCANGVWGHFIIDGDCNCSQSAGGVSG